MNIVDILELLVPDVWTAITQLCATAILFFLMYKLAWKPVKKILDERSKFEQQKLSEAAALKEENEKIHEQAKDPGDGILNWNALIEEGKKQSAQLLENARHDMELQRTKMMEEMRSEIVDTAISAAEKVLESKIDSDAEKQSISSFVKEVINK